MDGDYGHEDNHGEEEKEVGTEKQAQEIFVRRKRKPPSGSVECKTSNEK